MFLQVVLSIVLVFILTYRWRTRRLRALWKQLPCDIPGLPFIGHAHRFMGGGIARMETWQLFGREALKHGGITRLKMGSQFTVLADPVDADFASKNILEKDFIMEPLKFYIGNGSLAAPVSMWRPRRKIIVSAFNHNKLMKFVDIFAEQSNILIEKLKNVAGKGCFPLWDYTNRYTMDTVCETNLGVKTYAQAKDHPFLEAFESCLQTVSERICQPWLQIELVFKLFGKYERAVNERDVMNSFILQTVKTKREEMENNVKDSKDTEYNTFEKRTEPLMELLIKASSSDGQIGYSDEELREEIIVITMAGTDTTAVALSFILLVLAKYPEVQNKLYDELSNYYQDSKKSVESDDLIHLRYLECVIKESLRLYTPVPVTVRKVVKDTKLPSGVTVLAGSSVVLHIWAIHRNKKYWGEDAEVFRPERFLEGPLKHPAAFMPFSYGPRNCVGFQYAMLSLKTSVATIVRKFRIIESSECKKNLRLKFDVMMKDVDNYLVELETR